MTRPAQERSATREPTEDTAKRILTAAAKLFQTNGYEGTSVAAIAREAGVTAPALYWHFRSKQEVLAQFLMTVLVNFLETTQSSVVSTVPTTRLWQFAHAHVRAQLQDPTVSTAYGRLHSPATLANALPEDTQRKLTELQRRHFERCRDILRAGVQTGEFRKDLNIKVAAFFIITACEDVISWFRADGEKTADEVAALYADLAVRSVAASPCDARE